ncbi:tRNA-specific adenosine deaminase 2 [Alternaria panax]|uniref:tRNA(adenine(34)) deaminase n=1 Tax=Alternaria panax TaxID=48097 RepID=A0AAD4ICL0_9PLEO|nr:tRNA-specific adenosine deaminase 2 [Alternaria panax]
MTGIWQAKESCKALVFASAALGLTLYYLRARQTPTSKAADTCQLKTEQCQDDEAVHVPDAMDPEERAYHEGFMREAIAMAELALKSDETPVGCVFVKDGEVIGRGMNETNRTLNGTRHAEFVAIAGILSKHPISILNETDLYVTVEPCVMCASMLRQYGIRAVYFGCWNERFGGTGGVLNIHSDPSVDKPYPVTGGIFREEAIMLLRKFYVQENEKAPEPKQKKTRELKTEILPMDVHQPKSTPSPAIRAPANATSTGSIPTLSSLAASATAAAVAVPKFPPPAQSRPSSASTALA